MVVVGKTLLPIMTPKELDPLSLQFLQPMFRTHDFGVNVYRTAVSLASLSGKAPAPQEVKRSKRKAGFWMNLGVVILMIYALWRFTRPERRHPFPRWKKGEYWGTGQGGFGGNFGGFGGGTRGQQLK